MQFARINNNKYIIKDYNYFILNMFIKDVQ